MTVVINEFEVVAEPQSAKAAPGKTPDTATSQPSGIPSPHDIQRILRHQQERLARVRAY